MVGQLATFRLLLRQTVVMRHRFETRLVRLFGAAEFAKAKPHEPAAHRM